MKDVINYPRCKTCKRLLRVPVSITRGYGPRCFRKYLRYLNEEYEKNQLTIYQFLEDD